MRYLDEKLQHVFEALVRASIPSVYRWQNPPLRGHLPCCILQCPVDAHCHFQVDLYVNSATPRRHTPHQTTMGVFEVVRHIVGSIVFPINENIVILAACFLVEHDRKISILVDYPIPHE
jgi:hypothetical protein